MDRLSVTACCRFTFQWVTYGMRRLRLTEKISQALTEQSICETVNTGVFGAQFRLVIPCMGPAFMLPVPFAPPGPIPSAPVGTMLIPVVPGSLVKLNWPTKVLKLGMAYWIPAP